MQGLPVFVKEEDNSNLSDKNAAFFGVGRRLEGEKGSPGEKSGSGPDRRKCEYSRHP